MAGWLHGVFVVDWLFVFPLCGFSLSLFCNYQFACKRERRSDAGGMQEEGGSMLEQTNGLKGVPTV